MNFRTKTWLMAVFMVAFTGATALAAVALQPCDPAAARGTVGSCQFPNTTFPNGGPDCYVCQAVVGAQNTCVPDDSFCDSIAGGAGTNDCRIATCNVQFFDANHPTGCDFIVDPSPTPIPQCFQCNDVTVPFANHCPNGSCEPGKGETTSTCPEDCLVPGITPTPLPTQAEMDTACSAKPITFDGPPFNRPGLMTCEDGDVCTQDSCANNACVHVDLNATSACSEATSDLCCPAKCHAPVPGQDCANDPTCDVDCKPQIPCPSPTPPPTPVVLKCIEGSGVFGSTKSGLPTCKGFSCSLNPLAEEAPGFALLVLVIAGLGYGAYRNFRRNEG